MDFDINGDTAIYIFECVSDFLQNFRIHIWGVSFSVWDLALGLFAAWILASFLQYIFFGGDNHYE